MTRRKEEDSRQVQFARKVVQGYRTKTQSTKASQLGVTSSLFSSRGIGRALRKMSGKGEHDQIKDKTNSEEKLSTTFGDQSHRRQIELPFSVLPKQSLTSLTDA